MRLLAFVYMYFVYLASNLILLNMTSLAVPVTVGLSTASPLATDSGHLDKLSRAHQNISLSEDLPSSKKPGETVQKRQPEPVILRRSGLSRHSGDQMLSSASEMHYVAEDVHHCHHHHAPHHPHPYPCCHKPSVASVNLMLAPPFHHMMPGHMMQPPMMMMPLPPVLPTVAPTANPGLTSINMLTQQLLMMALG